MTRAHKIHTVVVPASLSSPAVAVFGGVMRTNGDAVAAPNAGLIHPHRNEIYSPIGEGGRRVPRAVTPPDSGLGLPNAFNIIDMRTLGVLFYDYSG